MTHVLTFQCVAELHQHSEREWWRFLLLNMLNIPELLRKCSHFVHAYVSVKDPTDPAKTVIVIRSLVPEGVAELDGRLLPGDRLMYVNSMNLESASLEEAVQALKGASLGTVHIGVAKPLPVRHRYTFMLNNNVCVLCVCVMLLSAIETFAPVT